MPFTLVWIIFLVALFIVFKFMPGLARRLTLGMLGEQGRAAVGAKALAGQPDQITLLPYSLPPGAAAGGLLGGLARAGFRPAGAFSIREMGGMPVHFMLKADESAVSAVYEHPQAGVWFDLFTRYEDGTSFTLATTKMGGGLEPRPGHPSVRAPGLDPAAARERFLRERPRGAMKSFASADLPAMFAAAYAESIAWRKQRGISAAEVQKVGMEKFK